MSPNYNALTLLFKRKIALGFTLVLLSNCAQKTLKVPDEKVLKFSQFKEKEKFSEENFTLTSQVDVARMKSVLTQKINKIADEFAAVSHTNQPSEADYQNQIQLGLASFSEIYLLLDTEYRELICEYIQELMNIVALKSSNGQLNHFLYGIDPNGLDKQ